jgi:hypothetical protein
VEYIFITWLYGNLHCFLCWHDKEHGMTMAQ